MALVGRVGGYVDGKEDIASYIERMELYYTFIAFIVSDACGVLRNLLAPKNPKYKSFVQ